MSFLGELHRRNVVRVGIAYVVTTWVLLQVADVVMENIGAPPWVMQALLFVMVIGLLPALLFAWVFELTPEGLKRESEIDAGASVVHETRRKLDMLIILMLVGAVGYLFWDGRLREKAADDPQIASSSGPELAAAPSDYSPAADEKSIAVLPFVNLSSDPEQEFFSDGISEELLNVLAQIPELRVAARTSSFQFKGDNRDIGEIARLLKVNHVLEGSVRKAGTTLRITAQLIEAEHGYHLWSNTYDRELADVFAIQDEISLAIGDALKAQLQLDGADGQPAVAATSNTAAYEAFLKGRALINKRGNVAITAGVRELEKSVRLDPDYAPARAQLAMGISLLAATSGSYGDLPLVEVNERAGEQLRIAEALAPNIAEVWAAKALLSNMNSRDREVVTFADKALAIRANYSEVLNWKVNALRFLGGHEEANVVRELILELDPLSIIGRLNAVSTIANSDPERALAIAKSLEPQSQWASYTALAQIYLRTGDIVEELQALFGAYALDSRDLLVNNALAYAFVRTDLMTESQRVAREVRPLARLAANQFEEAESGLRRMYNADPSSVELRALLAGAVYGQGRYAEAIELYEGSVVETESGPLVYSNGGSIPSLAYLHALQVEGRSEAAAAVAQALRIDLNGRAGANGATKWIWLFMGLLEAAQGNESQALQLLQKSVDDGLGDVYVLDYPPLDALGDRDAVEALRAQVRARAARNRELALTLICDNNPIPEHWRPLDSTCEGR